MDSADRESPSISLFSRITFLSVVLLAFIGVVAYWRLNNQSGVIYRQVQLSHGSLTQQMQGLDASVANTAQELTAMRARIGALDADDSEPRDYGPELAAIRSEIVTLQAEVSDLGRRIDAVAAASESTAPATEPSSRPQANPSPSAGSVSPGSVSLGVSVYQQSHNLSCEAATAVMVADYFHVPLSEEQAIASVPRDENPNLGFRGDIDGPPGGIGDYGVHAAPLRDMLAIHGLKAAPVEGGVEGIRTALDAGHPVIAWVTYQLSQQTPVQLELTDGTTVKVVPYEHTIVIDGYTTDGLLGIDPFDAQRKVLPWQDFERSWGYLDQMGLEISWP